MEYAVVTFVICVVVIVGAYWLLVAKPEAAEAKRLGKRLKGTTGQSSLVVGVASGEPGADVRVGSLPAPQHQAAGDLNHRASAGRGVPEAVLER